MNLAKLDWSSSTRQEFALRCLADLDLTLPNSPPKFWGRGWIDRALEEPEQYLVSGEVLIELGKLAEECF